MTIISILVAFSLCHFVRELARIRRFEWLEQLSGWVTLRLGDLPWWVHYLVLLALPMAVLLLAQAFFDSLLGILGEFLLSLAVLVYCFGPRDIDTQVAEIVAAEDDDTRSYRMAELIGTTDVPNGRAGEALAVEAVFQQALRRWFGVIFWFAVAGIFGALFYRVVTVLAEGRGELAPGTRSLFLHTRQIMDWPVAQLMTLALALATDFDSVFAAWKRYHDEQGHGLFEGDNGFLLASARTIVLSGHAARDGYADQLDGPLVCLQQAMDLAWRALAVWLFALSVLLLINVIS